MRYITILLLLTVGCAHTTSERQPVDPSVCTQHLERCETKQDADLCRAAITCFDLLGKTMKCELRLKAAQDLCAIDAQEQANEVYSLKRQRWMYGIVGVVVGALVTGLTVGLSR